MAKRTMIIPKTGIKLYDDILDYLKRRSPNPQNAQYCRHVAAHCHSSMYHVKNAIKAIQLNMNIGILKTRHRGYVLSGLANQIDDLDSLRGTMGILAWIDRDLRSSVNDIRANWPRHQIDPVLNYIFRPNANQHYASDINLLKALFDKVNTGLSKNSNFRI